MLDILEDSTGNLEIERFKCKLREIWMRILDETHTEEDGSKEEFMEANALHFADEPQPENEIDNLMDMLEDMLDPKEDLESIKGESKAQTYNGSQLKSNNEKGKIEVTKYETHHAMTHTPKDSKSSAKSNTYEHHTGKIAPRKDSQVKRSYSPMVQKIVEELLELDNRQGIGRRKMLFRL